MSYGYKWGVFLTRAQIVTNSHVECKMKVAEDCERILVVIGSDNKEGTKDNPFSISVRMDMMRDVIKEKFPGQEHRFRVVSLADYSYTNNRDPANAPKWGKYFYDFACEQIGETGFAYYTGEPIEEVEKWFNGIPGGEFVTIEPLRLEGAPIRATEAREAMERNNRMAFLAMCPASIIMRYETLREMYLKVLANPKSDFSANDGETLK